MVVVMAAEEVNKTIQFQLAMFPDTEQLKLEKDKFEDILLLDIIALIEKFTWWFHT